MSVEKIRAQLVSAIWQAVAQSEVDLSSVPGPEQEKLVGRIADSVMVTMDSILVEGADQAESGILEEDGAESVIWKGRPFLSLVETYTLTSERIKITHGLFSRRVENYELIRIQDIDYKQNVTERMVNVGDIFIRGQDASDPQIVLRNVTQPEEVYETLRKAWLAARKRHGLQFREYM